MSQSKITKGDIVYKFIFSQPGFTKFDIIEIGTQANGDKIYADTVIFENAGAALEFANTINNKFQVKSSRNNCDKTPINYTTKQPYKNGEDSESQHFITLFEKDINLIKTALESPATSLSDSGASQPLVLRDKANFILARFTKKEDDITLNVNIENKTVNFRSKNESILEDLRSALEKYDSDTIIQIGVAKDDKSEDYYFTLGESTIDGIFNHLGTTKAR